METRGDKHLMTMRQQCVKDRKKHIVGFRMHNEVFKHTLEITQMIQEQGELWNGRM